MMITFCSTRISGDFADFFNHQKARNAANVLVSGYFRLEPEKPPSTGGIDSLEDQDPPNKIYFWGIRSISGRSPVKEKSLIRVFFPDATSGNVRMSLPGNGF
jgi:hypothetical protein